MKLYRQFTRVLFRNYLIGSSAAVLGLGGLLVFSTIQLPTVQRWRLVGILLCSVSIMLCSEYWVFRRHIQPIKAFFEAPSSLALVQRAYHTTHRFPLLAVRRILGPHLLGLSAPALLLTLLSIRYHLINLPYPYLGLAALGAILVACMHALIEFFLTTQAIAPILQREMETARREHNVTLRMDGRMLVTIGRKFQLSAFLISTFPLFLFSVAAGVRFATLSTSVTISYWRWAISIVVVCVVFSVVSAYLLAKDVQSPIAYLYTLFARVRMGDLQTSALDYYSDEFSNLVAGFNHMVQGLREREQRNEQLVESYFATLAAALDARDPYTAGHSLRVADYSVRIAKLASLPTDTVDLLRRSALLHDIGKIGVPDSVLLKDGKLSDVEFEQIKQHPVLGENILKQVEPADAMGPLLPGVRSHHERYDGRGYPDGLVGRDIPLFGRIIAVADAFDAMTSDRPYRKGMPRQKALAILDEGRESQWDPEFAALFVASFADPSSASEKEVASTALD